MQQLIHATLNGKVDNLTLSILLRIDGAWVPIEQAGDYGVRVLQIIESTRSGWLALIERTAASAPSSPAAP
jgi:hypothetical protein